MKSLTTIFLATFGMIASSCFSQVTLVHDPEFGEQIAVISPHDETGGRFNGAHISPGFGVLYLNGYTSETGEPLDCGGFTSDEPEHIVEFDYPMTMKLVLQTEDNLVLGVTAPDGELTCGDPRSTTNANVSLTHAFESGTYSIWVGSQVEGTSSAYRLVLSE